LEAPSQTPTTMAPPTFDTPTPGQAGGGIGYGADIPHTGTLSITMPPIPGVSTPPGQPTTNTDASRTVNSEITESSQIRSLSPETTAINSEPSAIIKPREDVAISHDSSQTPSSQANSTKINKDSATCDDGYHYSWGNFGCMPDYDYNTRLIAIYPDHPAAGQLPVATCQPDLSVGMGCSESQSLAIGITHEQSVTDTTSTSVSSSFGISDGVVANMASSAERSRGISVSNAMSYTFTSTQTCSFAPPPSPDLVGGMYISYDWYLFEIDQYDTRQERNVGVRFEWIKIPVGIRCQYNPPGVGFRS
ncbi:MAG: hypothetical protein ACRCSF_06505, partial [Mycobacteriaceae bacterium]